MPAGPILAAPVIGTPSDRCLPCFRPFSRSQRSATPSCPLGPTVRLTARSPKRLFHLVLESHDTRAPGADSEEKHEPVSDIDTVVVDSLKALDLNGRLEKRTFRQRPFYEFAP